MITKIGDTSKQLEVAILVDGEVWTVARIRELQKSRAKAVRDAIVSALRLYGEPTLSPSEIEALAERYVQNVVMGAKDVDN